MLDLEFILSIGRVGTAHLAPLAIAPAPMNDHAVIIAESALDWTKRIQTYDPSPLVVLRAKERLADTEPFGSRVQAALDIAFRHPKLWAQVREEMQDDLKKQQAKKRKLEAQQHAEDRARRRREESLKRREDLARAEAANLAHRLAIEAVARVI